VKNSSESQTNRYKIIQFVTNGDVLKAAYDRVAKSSGVTYGEKPQIDEIYLQKLSQEIGNGMYQCSPSKRIYIPKPNGGQRPLGIPSLKDKIVQQAIKMVLEPIFETQFIEHSHGFRPKRGTLTALKQIRNTFTSVK
jgi:retron-type reverse transcriptase